MLVGRDREAADLAGALGAGLAPVVCGPAGIGKTSLVRHVAAGLGRVAEGGALASLSWRAYLPLGRAVADLDLGGAPGAVADTVARRVGSGVLFLDDLQYADPQTLATLPMLVGRVRVVATVRRAEDGTAAALAAATGAGFAVQEIGPLAHADAVAVVRDRHPDLDDDGVAGIVRSAGGNSLLLRELDPSGAISPSLRYVLGARLGRCGSDASRAMARLALLGRPAAEGLLGPGVDELVDAGLVEREGGLVVVRHGLLADAVVEGVDGGRRRAVHRELAAAVDEPGEAARHHAAAGDPDRAIAAALRAAAAAVRPGERARHLELAADQGAEVRVRLDAAEALVAAGDHAAAERVASTITADDPADAAEARLYRARAACRTGDIASIRGHIEAGLALVAGTRSPTEARLLVELAWWHCGLDYDAARAGSVARRAHELCVELDVEQERARAILDAARIAAGDLAEPEAPETAGGVDGRAVSEMAGILRTYLTGDAAGAERAAEHGARWCRENGMVGWDLQLRAAGSMIVLHRRGASDGYLSTCRELLAEPLLPRMRAQVTARYAIACSDLGRTAEAGDLVTKGLRQVVEPTGRAHLLWAQAEQAWARRDSRATVDYAESALEFVIAWHPLTVILDVLRIWGYVERRGETPPDRPTPSYPALSAAGDERKALAMMAAGDPAASEVFSEAARGWAGHERRGELRCRWAAGEAARRVGDPAAVGLLRAVETACRDRGHVGLLGRILRSLRKAGVGVPGPRADRRVLSARETEVVLLVGEGLSNAAIAGRLGTATATVDAQLRSARRKLGARTRWEAFELLCAAGVT